MKKCVIVLLILSLFMARVYADGESADNIPSESDVSVSQPTLIDMDTIGTAFNGVSESVPLSERGYPAKLENGLKLNVDIYNEYGVVAYGEPEDYHPNGEPRYLGYTPTGEKISNYKHPYDIDPPTGANFSEYPWIENPQKKDAIINAYPDVQKNDYDTPEVRAQYLDSFLLGIASQHKDYFTQTKSPSEWLDYFHIITPPTDHSHGVARMWFKNSSNNLRYIDVILVANSIADKAMGIALKHEGNDVTNNGSSPIQILASEPEDVTIEVINLANNIKASSYEFYKDGSLFATTSDPSDSVSDTIPFGETSRTYSIKPILQVADDTIASASATVSIEVVEELEGEIHLFIDYDQLSKNFTVQLNEGAGVALDFGDPPQNGIWTEPLVGHLDVTYPSISNLNDNSVVSGVDVYTTGNSGSVYPQLYFETRREAFGDNPASGSYLANGNYEQSFFVGAAGEASRSYEPDNFVPEDVNMDGIIDNMPNPVQRFFDPVLNKEIIITALTYNGNAVDPTIPVPTGEAVVNEEISRSIEWQGHGIPFLVSRMMYEMDGTEVEVPGQYTRTFIPDNSAFVTFTPRTSTFVDTYRGETYSIDGMHVNAPYTTDSKAVATYNATGMNTLKSGYFYEVQGAYTAVVTSVVYVRDGADTGHDDLVDSVIDEFRIISSIPTVSDANDTDRFLPYFDDRSGNIPVTINYDTDRKQTVMAESKYAPFMETNGGMKYEEQLSTLSSLGQIYRVEETTVIHFNIPKTKYYTDVSGADGKYYITGYIEGFTLPSGYIGGSHSGDLSVAELPQGILRTSNNMHFFREDYIYNFLIDGNMYEDIYVSD